MAGNKSSEGKEISEKQRKIDDLFGPGYASGTLDNPGGMLMAGGTDYGSGESRSVGTITVDIDCTDALKGLKAIQREAKKATAALKELSETTPDSLAGLAVSKSIQAANGYKPHTVIFDEMHTICHRCGSDNTTLQSLGENIKGFKLVCDDCGWELK